MESSMNKLNLLLESIVLLCILCLSSLMLFLFLPCTSGDNWMRKSEDLCKT